MKYFLGLLFLICSTVVFAQGDVEPEVKSNVTILQNATPAQCEAARNADTGPVDVEGESSLGGYTGTSGPGVRSCENCAVDSQQNCVCGTCYYYYN